MTDFNTLRKVSIEGYTLATWDTNRTDALGKYIIGYRFSDPNGEVIFEAEDFACSPMVAIDSDDCLRAILGFLTLRPGDTDAEYFANYTEAQSDFAATDAEALSMYAIEEMGLPFSDLT